GHDQSRFSRQVALFLKQSREMRRDRPEEAVAIIEIVEPFAVADQVGLRDLDLNDGETAFGVYGHQVCSPAVGQRHLAYSEQILAAKQAGNAPRDLAGDWRGIRKAQRIELGGHAKELEQIDNTANENGQAEACP